MIVVYNNYYDKLIPYNNSTCMRTILLWIFMYEDFKFHSIDDLYRQLNYSGAFLVFYNTE